MKFQLINPAPSPQGIKPCGKNLFPFIPVAETTGYSGRCWIKLLLKKTALIFFLVSLFFIISPKSVLAEEDYGACYICDNFFNQQECLIIDSMYEIENMERNYNNCQRDDCNDPLCRAVIDIIEEGEIMNRTQDVQEEMGGKLKLKLNVAIPGLEEFSEGEGVEVNNQTIAIYIGGLYKFFVGIAGILAVVMIAIGGFIWLFSGGDAGKITNAKETIFGAVIGLILALSSYMILYIINPNLVEFKGLPVLDILPIGDDSCRPVKNSADGCQNLVDLDNSKIKIAGVEVVTKMQEGASLALYELADAWYLRYEKQLYLNDAFRSPAKQAYYYCSLGPSLANKPGTSTHELGIAFDIDFEESGINEDNFQEFVRLATSKGFKCDTPVWGASESWHFTYQGDKIMDYATICPYINTYDLSENL